MHSSKLSSDHDHLGPENAFPYKEKFSLAEPHHAHAAPVPTLLYTKPTFLKQAKVNMTLSAIFTLVSNDLNWYKIKWEK
jgi:hypothetical protein